MGLVMFKVTYDQSKILQHQKKLSSLFNLRIPLLSHSNDPSNNPTTHKTLSQTLCFSSTQHLQSRPPLRMMSCISTVHSTLVDFYRPIVKLIYGLLLTGLGAVGFWVGATMMFDPNPSDAFWGHIYLIFAFFPAIIGLCYVGTGILEIKWECDERAQGAEHPKSDELGPIPPV